ncbi:MAG: hypothetical protein DRP74_04220 [Candidatus Omnitrophota bacterium]|nr:MAG: hypothetical protein DRP74_04220 [Candidatus Omnitrophota bacterium]
MANKQDITKANTQKSIKWPHHLAYAVGLITSDGNSSSDGRHFSFVSKDTELIETFKRCLSLKNKIRPKTSGYSNKMYYKIQFGNIKLYKWLLNIGLMPNKTKRLSKIVIPDKYLPDFLRGHIDGDGCIRVYQDPIYPNSQRLYTRFISASLAHLLWLRKRIFSLLKIKGHMRQHTKGTFELSYAKKDSRTLLNAIYYNKFVPCLRRKRKIAELFLSN